MAIRTARRGSPGLRFLPRGTRTDAAIRQAPDLLLFPAGQRSQRICPRRRRDESVVAQAVAAIEVRSSKFEALTYMDVRKRQREAGRTATGDAKLTVKVEYLVIVVVG